MSFLKNLFSKKSEKIENDNEEKNVKVSFFESLKDKLINSRTGLFGKIKGFFQGRSVIDSDMYEELEELLVQSDIGLDMSLKIIDTLEKEVRSRGIKDPNEVYPVLKDVMKNFLITENNSLEIKEGQLNVILIVGVNGVGKTTTIGKIASKYVRKGKKVVIGAGDTFRAAAVEQVEEWGKRAGCEVIKSLKDGGDPGAVVYDTLKIAKEKSADIAIIDTAGRLHNKNNLMAELEKINNIIKKNIGEQSYETILVIDGTTGQNALSQAKVFNEVAKLTGFIVTKLDGTAKGGIVFSISEELKKPIKYIGVGEKIEDLREFDAKEYIDAIFE
ncbi:MAG: signal recognition particle-docking protein FtsY [Fusobacteriaceae bacterium]|nr:signal recognition particle-docking protein FtsY [Fusobacteriaceae bacterium]